MGQSRTTFRDFLVGQDEVSVVKKKESTTNEYP